MSSKDKDKYGIINAFFMFINLLHLMCYHFRKSKADSKLMVKKFVRSGAGQKQSLPENIRTSDALVKTVYYLIDKYIRLGLITLVLQSTNAFILLTEYTIKLIILVILFTILSVIAF